VWKRTKPERVEPVDGPIGVGVQVYVMEDSGSSDSGWVGDPTGVVVARGSAIAGSALDVERLSGRVWVVAFDEPQFRGDGRGPYDRADVAEAFLIPAPPVA
jgi:hypothetical protein